MALIDSITEQSVREASTTVFAYVSKFDTCDLVSMKVFINDELSKRTACDPNVIYKNTPVVSTDCLNKDHRFCEGSDPALWPDGETTIRKCSCACHFEYALEMP